MPFCAFDDGGAMLGTTSVSNMFLMEYMPSAPSEFVKVYLYGLLLCRYPALCDGIEKMAQTLHLDPNTVKNALSHWEREGAVVKLSDNPPSYSFITLSPNADDRDEVEKSVYTNREYIRTLQSLMPSLALENHELGIANDWLDVFGLDIDTVYFMVKSYAEKKGDRLPAAKTAFKNLNDIAKEWATNGVKDVNSAKDYLARSSKYSSVAREVINRFNFRREPTKDEINDVKGWMDTLGCTREEILSACSETTASGSPSFRYLGGILQNKKNGPDDGAFEQVKKLNAHLGINARPSPDQIQSFKDFLEMGFASDAVEQAAIQCGANNKRTYDDIKKTLVKWKEIGAMTVAEIEEERRQQKHYYDIMHRLLECAGVEKKITASDIKYAKVWTALIEQDALMLAAEQARGFDAPIKYIDKLVKIWSAQGITTLEKAREATQAHSVGKNPNKILTERELSEDDFGDDFYADIMNRKRAGE